MSNSNLSFAEIRALFPVVDQWTYLYNGSIHPCPRPVAEAMTRYITDWSKGGEAAVFPALDAFEQYKEKLANLIVGSSANIVVTESTTAAINLAARLIEPKEGQNVVVTDLAFMSNTYPWLVSFANSLETRVVESKEGRVEPGDIGAMVDGDTAAVHICSVTVGSGYRYNLQEVFEITNRNHIPLLIDGAQAVGLVEVDVKNPTVDFLAGTASKWLMGPAGVGYLYVADRYLGATPPAAGWYAAANVADWDVRHCELHDDAKRFQGGIPNLIGVVGALAGLELLEQIGREYIENRVRNLTRYLYQELKEIGVSLWTPPIEAERAGIIFFRTKDHERLHKTLKAGRIYCGSFQGGIRVDPGVYNTEEELDRFLAVVRDHVARLSHNVNPSKSWLRPRYM